MKATINILSILLVSISMAFAASGAQVTTDSTCCTNRARCTVLFDAFSFDAVLVDSDLFDNIVTNRDISSNSEPVLYGLAIVSGYSVNNAYSVIDKNISPLLLDIPPPGR